jgi:hypothetical protein
MIGIGIIGTIHIIGIIGIIIGYIFFLAYKSGFLKPVGFLGLSTCLVISIYGQLKGIVLTHTITWIILGSVVALLRNKNKINN